MSWLWILLLLLCPLSMMFMMRGHQHDGQSGGDSNIHANHIYGDHPNSEPARIDSYKLKQLEGEVELLKNQNEILQKKLEEFSKSNAKRKDE